MENDRYFITPEDYDTAVGKLIDLYRMKFDELVEAEAFKRRINKVADDLVRMNNGSHRLTAIKILRTAFGIGLVEAKSAYEGAEQRVNGNDIPF